MLYHILHCKLVILILSEMKNNVGKILIIGSILFAGFSCDSEYLSYGDYFFLKNKGAVMPVWVKGNLNSEVMIITVHGGPGGSGHDFPLSDGFKLLEHKYALVYWDQRFSGLSQGNPKNSTLTVDQFVEDVSKIVQLIKHKYPGRKYFLLGHSWGGGLSAAYLGRNNNCNGINGWIDVDGSVIDKLEVQEQKKWILERVPLHYSKNPKHWQYIIDWYKSHPYPVYSDKEPYQYLEELGAYVTTEHYRPYLKLTFASPFSISFFTNNVNSSFADGIDFTNELKNINIPTLIVWGKEDGILPCNLADSTYYRVGSSSTDKQIVLVNNAAHAPFYDNPTEFAEAVGKFIELYKNN